MLKKWPLPIPAWFWAWVRWVRAGRPAGKRPAGAPARIPGWAWRRLKAMGGGWRKPKPPAEFTMYDDVNLDLIPRDAVAVAGYVNGRWPTYPKLAAMFPKALRLSIAVSSGADADCLDVEPGDATVAQAAGWVKRQHALGARRPCVYTSVSNAAALLDALTKAGIARHEYRLWTAHYTGKPHRCSRLCWPGFTGVADATQYTDKALGRSLDASLCAPGFLNGGNL